MTQRYRSAHKTSTCATAIFRILLPFVLANTSPLDLRQYIHRIEVGIPLMTFFFVCVSNSNDEIALLCSVKLFHYTARNKLSIHKNNLSTAAYTKVFKRAESIYIQCLLYQTREELINKVLKKYAYVVHIHSIYVDILLVANVPQRTHTLRIINIQRT